MKKQQKLQTRLFKAYLLLAGLILFSYAAFSSFFMARNLTSSQIEAMNTLNNSFRTQVEASINNLDIVSVNINYSNISKDVLNQTFDLDITEAMLTDMADLFLSISGTELKADQINLYDSSGHVLQAGLSTMVKNQVSTPDWMEKAQELKGSKIISLPYETGIYSKSAKYKQWFISLYRSFNNQYGRSVGAIETVKQCKSVFKSLISYQKRNKDHGAKTYIFDRDGNLVYPYDIAREEAASIMPYFTAAINEQHSTIISPVTNHREYVARETSNYTGYTYMTVQPRAQVLAPVYEQLRILFLAAIVFLLLSAAISYRLSRSIVKPIKHLKHIIQRLELDTLGQEQATTYPVPVGELEELYQAYQNMSDHLKDSMNQLMEAQEQEIRSRAMALQTQINPHFYYNSLSSIMILAENQDTDTVIQMCRNLSNIMRYITNTGSSIVTLADEIDYVRKYLYCMKVRYQSSLNYTIDIDPSLLDQKVPKLIIQPVVENAIKYGSDCAPPWNISIRGFREKDCWKIQVEDSGTGFTKEAMEKIAGNIRSATENPGLPELKINGLGTLNVYLRWKLFCKDDMIFIYGNTEEGHGIVTIGRYEKNTVPDPAPKES